MLKLRSSHITIFRANGFNFSLQFDLVLGVANMLFQLVVL